MTDQELLDSVKATEEAGWKAVGKKPKKWRFSLGWWTLQCCIFTISLIVTSAFMHYSDLKGSAAPIVHHEFKEEWITGDSTGAIILSDAVYLDIHFQGTQFERKAKQFLKEHPGYKTSTEVRVCFEEGCKDMTFAEFKRRISE